MRARVVVGGVLVSIGILAAGVESAIHHTVPGPTTDAGTSGTGTSGTDTGSTSTGGTSSAPTAPASTAPSSGTSASSGTSTSSGTSASGGTTASSGLRDGSFTGAAEQTPYGDVQVKVTVSGGKITDVTALQLTNEGGRSVAISDYAAPILRKEAISADSAKIDAVSGATYTSDGYIGSLQSALDKAK